MSALTSFLHHAPRPFVLLDAVDHVDAGGLRAMRHFHAAPVWQLWEAGAQCAALHQRHACGFQRHAFLLGMANCPLPPAGDSLTDGRLDGRVLLSARLQGQAGRAALYTLHCVFPDHPRFTPSPEPWEVRIGLADYDERFRRDLLRQRYEEIFACLCQRAACMPD